MVSSINKRREKDVMKLLVSDYEVQQVNENSTCEFIIKFEGPKESPYEGVKYILYNNCDANMNNLDYTFTLFIRNPVISAPLFPQ
jgi:ubiquitin-protein ligase